MDEHSLIAEGWKPLPTIRYSAALGPTFSRVVEGQLEVCLLAQDHLGNDNLGIVHGGAMMTFGDMALGCAVGQVAAGQLFVTVQLQFQFVAAANVGTLVTCAPQVVRRTSQLVFVRGLIENCGRPVASADGIFKLLDTEKAARLRAD